MDRCVEEWRPVVGYEGLYEVSNFGNVRSLDRLVKSKGESKRLAPSKVLKQHTDKDGYRRVGLHYEDKQITVGVHRLVAQAFIDNLENLPAIDHIDGVRDNNFVGNLRWCSIMQNNSTELAKQRKSLAAYKRIDNKKKIIQHSISGDVIKVFNSSMEIQRELGYKRAAISRCCKGKQKTSYGYKWSFLD